MRERNGLVVRVYEGKVLVLSEGDFIYVETNGKKYERGQEITFYTKTETKSVINWNRVISYASVPVVVSLFLLIGFPSVNSPETLNKPTEKSPIIAMKPVTPKPNVMTPIEPKLDSINEVEIRTPQKEEDEQIISPIPSKVKKKKTTKPGNDEPKQPPQNKEPVQDNPDRKENLPAPHEEEPAPKTEPIPGKDSNNHDNRDNSILTFGIDREKISVSVAQICVKVPLRKSWN